jgi:hypothetical protein
VVNSAVFTAQHLTKSAISTAHVNKSVVFTAKHVDKSVVFTANVNKSVVTQHVDK